jgi:hypothetical protein
MIRTHDMEAIDWSLNFPYPTMDADPDDPGLMDRVEAILRGQAPDSV